MSPLKGDAGFKYDPGAGVVTVALNWPLFRIQPASARVRFDEWSLSRKVRETLVVDSGVPELLGSIRFHDDPVELLAMLDAGADGVQLTYYPSLAVPGTNYPCLLVEPSGEQIAALRDSSPRGRFGEYEVQLRLRRVDGGTFAALFP